MKRSHNQIVNYAPMKGAGAKNDSHKRFKRGNFEGFAPAVGKRGAPVDMGGLTNLAPLLARTGRSDANPPGLSAKGPQAVPKDQGESAMQIDSGKDQDNAINNQIDETISAQATSLASLY